MSYIELYNKDIVDSVSVGRTINNFKESNGDYIKVEIFRGDSNFILATAHSNRLLLKYPNTIDGYYFGDYHYHPENIEMGFCEGAVHTDESAINLTPIKINENNLAEPLDGGQFKKQIEIFRDDKEGLHIKPNDILKLLNLPRDKYKLRIHFLKNIKSPLGKFLNTMKNNLIENGNFFAGLEATQTGDLDKSSGKNNFLKISNPGFSQYVLCQNGLPGNQYNMKITGIKPDKNYVFSCWVAWNDNFNGSVGIASFDKVSTQSNSGLAAVPDTDLGGSSLDGEKNILQRTISGIKWYKVFMFVKTTSNANLGNLILNLGKNTDDGFFPSTNPLGHRYFTDLRFVEVDSLVGQPIVNYIDTLKNEEHNLNLVQYSDIKKQSMQKEVSPNQYVKDGDGETEYSKNIINKYNSISIEEMLSDNITNGFGDDLGLDDYDAEKGGIIKRRRR